MGAVAAQVDFATANGWSRSYVTKLKQQGRLVMQGDKVDVEASMERIRQTTTAPERAAPAVQGGAYSGAQERERHYSAELKRLEFERELGRLRDADEVAAVLNDAAAVFRAGVEAWSHTLAPMVAALGGDEARIAALLAEEGDDLLRRVSKRFAALAGEAT